jgi:hypothetical protein
LPKGFDLDQYGGLVCTGRLKYGPSTKAQTLGLFLFLIHYYQYTKRTITHLPSILEWEGRMDIGFWRFRVSLGP